MWMHNIAAMNLITVHRNCKAFRIPWYILILADRICTIWRFGYCKMRTASCPRNISGRLTLLLPTSGRLTLLLPTSGRMTSGYLPQVDWPQVLATEGAGAGSASYWSCPPEKYLHISQASKQPGDLGGDSLVSVPCTWHSRVIWVVVAWSLCPVPDTAGWFGW